MATAFTREQFAFIVAQRAAYVSPEAVITAFLKRWPDTACTPSDVETADRSNLPDDWQKYFDQQREAFLDAPTTDSRVRIAELHRMFVIARDRLALELASTFLSQIAKETGSSGASGGAIGRVEVQRTIVDPK